METCNATYEEDSIFGDVESLLSPKIKPSSELKKSVAKQPIRFFETSTRMPETDQNENCMFNLDKDLLIELKNPAKTGDNNEYQLKDFEVHHGDDLSSTRNFEDYQDEISNHIESTKVSDAKVEEKAEDTSDVSSQPDFIKCLALRTDVMNKNIFRALRRECISLYEKFVKANNLPNPKRGNKKFMSNLRKFVQHFLRSSKVGMTLKDSVNYDTFVTYLGTLINYCAMKNSVKEDAKLQKVTRMHKLLYSYSHKKFYDFIRIPEISLIIRVLCDVLSTDTMISHNASLSANKKQYRAHVDSLLKFVSH